MAKPQDKKVLVVDDDPDVVYFLSTALEDAGFRFETAFNVDEALGKIEAEPPDFVSLDLVMPGKSGIVLFHTLRRNPVWSKIPVLFVTGEAKDEGIRRDLHAALAESSMYGPKTYFEKPVTARKFVTAVAEALGVELEGAPSTTESTASPIEEVKTLISDADPQVLDQILQLLKSKSRS